MTEHLSIIPYTIVCCLSQLDNIYETRLFGWVMAKAQSVLKLYNKDLSDINVEHAMRLTRVTIPARYLLSEKDDNYCNIRKAFTLADKKIEYERENRKYYLSIIAFPEYVKDGRSSFVTFVIHNEVWHALLNFSKGYRIFSMSSFMRLNSPYAVIMYLLVSQQTKPMTYTVMQLRKLLGCDTLKSYDRGNNFFVRIIDPARKELREKTPFSFEYSAARTGRGGSYTSITILPKLNQPQDAVSADTDSERKEAIEAMRVRLSDEVKWYLQANFEFDANGLQTVEKLLPAQWTDQQIVTELEKIRHTALVQRVKNKKGYCVNALKNLRP